MLLTPAIGVLYPALVHHVLSTGGARVFNKAKGKTILCTVWLFGWFWFCFVFFPIDY